MYKEIEKHYRENRERYVKIALRRFNGDWGLAEDSVQNAYVRAMEYKHCFNPTIKSFSSWMNAIFNNCIRDLKFQNNDVLLENFDVPVEVSLEKEMLEDVVRVLSNHYQLEKQFRHKEVIYYFYIKQLKPAEIKLLVDKVSLDNIYQILTRFRTLMKGM